VSISIRDQSESPANALMLFHAMPSSVRIYEGNE
jgi:hypothetical protein